VGAAPDRIGTWAARVLQKASHRSACRGLARIGFVSTGDEYVRFSLIENEHRTRQAIRSIARCSGAIS